MQPILAPETIHRANSLFWEQMLGMTLEPAPATLPPSFPPGTSILGRCDLSGAWFGSIQVLLTPGLALAATAAMLMQPAHTVQPDDTLDAVREITNMIAGTIKSALPRPCSMAVPHAELATQSPALPPNSLAVRFLHSSGEILVSVLPATPLQTLSELALSPSPIPSATPNPGLWPSSATALA